MRRMIIGGMIALALLSGCAAPDEAVTLPTRAVLPSATPFSESYSPTAATAIAQRPASDTPAAPVVVSSPTDASTRQPSDTAVPTATRLPPTATVTVPALTFPSPSPSRAPVAAADVTLVGGLPIPQLTAIRLPSATPTITLTPSHTMTPTIPGTPIGEASVTAANNFVVNIMDAPSYSARPIQAVANGENLFLVGRAWNNEWYQVRTMDGVQGWILGLYLVIWGDLSRVIVTHLEPTRPPIASVGEFSVGGHVMSMNQSAYGLMRQAGMTWLKIQHRYFVGQGAGEVAGIISAAHQAGFRVVIGVVGDKNQLATMPNYHASFAGFVAAVAVAGADAIEIWNEPNIDREWPRGFIHGGNYTDLLRASYTAIKAAQPTTIVISAAPAPTGFFGPAGCGEGGCNDDIFLTQMAFAGAQDFLDCVGLHHNDGIVSPAQGYGDPRGDHPTYFLRGVMSRVPSAFNSRPICFTEVGYLSPEGYGGLPPNFAWANSTSVAEHAQWLGEAVRIARTSGRVALFIVWNIDFTVYNYDDPMAGYAIRRADGSCPACGTIAAALR